MSILGLLVAMAIGMAVYYGVSTPSTSVLMAHVPGHGIGLAVLVALIILWAFVQFRPKRDLSDQNDDDEIR